MFVVQYKSPLGRVHKHSWQGQHTHAPWNWRVLDSIIYQKRCMMKHACSNRGHIRYAWLLIAYTPAANQKLYKFKRSYVRDITRIMYGHMCGAHITFVLNTWLVCSILSCLRSGSRLKLACKVEPVCNMSQRVHLWIHISSTRVRASGHTHCIETHQLDQI